MSAEPNTGARAEEGGPDDIVVYDPNVEVEPVEGEAIKEDQGETADSAMEDAAAAVPAAIRDDSVHVFRQHTSETLCVASNPCDPTMVASGSCDERAIVYDVSTRKDLAELDGSGESVSCLSFSSDGKHLAAGSENGAISVLFLGGAAAPQSVLDGPSEAITFLEWHPKGNVLLAGSEDMNAYMWQAAKGQFMMAFSGHTKAITAGGFTEDGKRVVTVSKDASIRIWSPTLGTTITRIQTGLPGIGAAFHALNQEILAFGTMRNLAITGDDRGKVYVCNIDTGKVLTECIGHQNGVETIKFFSGALSDVGVVLNLVATSGGDGIIRVRDLDSNHERCTLRHSGVISKVIWHPKVPVLVSVSSEGTICMWNVRTSEKMVELSGHTDFITDVCWAMECKALVSSSGDGTIRL